MTILQYILYDAIFWDRHILWLLIIEGSVVDHAIWAELGLELADFDSLRINSTCHMTFDRELNWPFWPIFNFISFNHNWWNHQLVYCKLVNTFIFQLSCLLLTSFYNCRPELVGSFFNQDQKLPPLEMFSSSYTYIVVLSITQYSLVIS